MLLRAVQFYKSITHGVAFIPLMTATLLVVLAVAISGYSQSHARTFPDLPRYLRVETVETARVLLGSILTSIISLTVFGFSMMMVVVNQAASNYSPKVVETFINQRFNQFIIGVYLGTILFTVVTLMRVDQQTGTNEVPHIGVLISVTLSTFSAVLFLSFINNISNSVRITNIVERIFRKTETSLRKKDKGASQTVAPNVEEWKTHEAHHSGYFQVIRVKPLLKILEDEDLILKVLPLPGVYYTNRTPLFSLNKNTGEKVLKRIRATFVTYIGEDIDENEFYGFRQLREVAVKALSPGVNDPGVARMCIDYLGDLLRLWMRTENNNIVLDDEQKARIILNRYDFESLLAETIAPIKVYAKADFTVINALLNVLEDLSLYEKEERERAAIVTYAIALVQDANQNIIGFLERKAVNQVIARMNNSRYFQLPALVEHDIH